MSTLLLCYKYSSDPCSKKQLSFPHDCRKGLGLVKLGNSAK